MRSILSLYFFSFVFTGTCLTLAPDVLLTDQVSPSNNFGPPSQEGDLSAQGLSDIADANNEACTSDAGNTGKNVLGSRNLVGRGKICVPPLQQNKPARVPTAPPSPPSPRPRQPSKINPDLPGHLDNLPESYPLLHLGPNEMNLDDEICSPTLTADRRYAYCDSGFNLDRVLHDKSGPRSWDLLRCQDFNPITGCFFGSEGYQASVWCCHEQTTTKSEFWGITNVCIDCVPYLELWEPLPHEYY